jgi:putative toxin-antitoxin system antitoxin component (TIGR02293 family)
MAWYFGQMAAGALDMNLEDMAEAPVRWAVSVLEEGPTGRWLGRLHNAHTAFDAHDLIGDGLPNGCIVRLGNRYLSGSGATPFFAIMGISQRTFQRCKSQPDDKPLSPEISGRLWKFAEVLGRASEVFSTREAAEAWMMAPAMALDGRCPVDLLTTPVGVEAVEDLLTRLKYDVYT